MASFFSLLRYSFGNEDWRTEEAALDIKPEDEVLCITASGDRPLNLLNRECLKMVSIDANPVQNHLLNLKAAAMQSFDYPEYLAFLGAAPCSNRKTMLKKVLPLLSDQSANFWIKHSKMIEKGIIYQGTVERLTALIAKIFSLTRGAKVKRLFAMQDIEEQREFVRNEWDSYLWRQTFKILLNPMISRYFVNDPGLANVGSNIKAGTYIYNRIQASLERDLANRNPLLSLLLRGTVSKEAFSPYLTNEGIHQIKKHLSRLEVHTSDIVGYLDSFQGPSFDVFSFSDIVSYMTYPSFVKLLENMIKTAKPGARFCLRQFLSTYEIPPHLKPFFVRDHSLETMLEHQDNCFVYRFMVGTISHAHAYQEVQSQIDQDVPSEELCDALIS